MTSESRVPDPLEFMKGLWSAMGVPMPGMVTPTLDIGELDKRITDLRAVEGWLRMNLGMLQMSIQTLEMQRNTLAAMQAMGEAGAAQAGEGAAAWPWPFLQPDPAAPGGKPPASGTKPSGK
ncbi:MAG: hypothetical protein OHK0026_18020 [Rhodocyclaceae bacterium]